MFKEAVARQGGRSAGQANALSTGYKVRHSLGGQPCGSGWFTSFPCFFLIRTHETSIGKDRLPEKWVPSPNSCFEILCKTATRLWSDFARHSTSIKGSRRDGEPPGTTLRFLPPQRKIFLSSISSAGRLRTKLIMFFWSEFCSLKSE